MQKLYSTRRDLFRFLAHSSLSLPFLPSLFTKLEAAQAHFPKRLIVLFSANGQFGPHWYPSSIPAGVNQYPLNNIEGPISRIIGSEFDPFRDKMLLLRGLDIIPTIDEHWGAKALSGFGQTYNRKPTIDQIVSHSLAVYPQEPFLRSLVAKAGGIPGNQRLIGATHSYAPFGKDTVTIVPRKDPRSIVEAIFPKLELSNKNGKILSQLHAQYKRLLSCDRLSSADRFRLEAHISFLNEIKGRYLNSSPNVCSSSNIANEIGGTEDLPTVMKDHMRLISAAIKCDITRVVRLNLTESAESLAFQFLPGVGPYEFHNYTHSFSPPAQVQFELVQQWLAKQVAYLLELLNEVEDPASGRTYLDNSIVYWANESGARPNDNPWNAHDDLDLPCLLVGDGQGYLSSGKFIDYRQIGVRRLWHSAMCPSEVCTHDENHNFIGRPINELLTTIMLGMGLVPSEWETEEEPGFGDYSENFNNQYKLGDRRSPLPLIVKS